MAKAVIMPKFGMTMEEGTIIGWLKEEGQVVEKGEPLLEVMTDKIVMEVEAPASGVLKGIRAFADEVVPVAQVIAYIAAPGEEIEEEKEAEPGVAVEVAALAPPAKRVRPTPTARRLAEESGVDLSRVAGSGPGGRITAADVRAYLERTAALLDRVRATPAARHLAKERGLDLKEVSGSGPEGVIIRADVAAFAARKPAAAPTPAAEEVQVVPLAGMRRVIAQRMQANAQTAPHITITMEVDMSEARRARERLLEPIQAETGQRLSMTALLVRAVAATLKHHPFVNATLAGEEIRLLPWINVGVAVALEEGLIVPVIPNADRKSLAEITVALEDLVRRARQNELTPDEVSGGTFTISNLGMYGVDEFTAIINLPESAILAVGQVKDRPIALDGEVSIRPIMKMSLSADHRVLDGAVAARFLADLKAALENPYLLI